MKFKEAELTVDGEKYVLREGTLEDTLPLLGRFSNPDEDRFLAQMDLLKLVTYRDGKLLGDEVGRLPQSAFMKLMPLALQVCGMGADDEST